jgi:hypothetical protein
MFRVLSVAQLQRTAIGVCMVLVCCFIGAGTGWDTGHGTRDIYVTKISSSVIFAFVII